MKTSHHAFLMAVLISCAAQAAPSDIIGHIQNIQGTATIERGNTTLPGIKGTALYRGDRIRTGKPGAVGIVLTDDTSVSLGASSILTLNDYDFDPKEGKFSLVMRMLKGTFSYISGQIVKLSPDAVQLQTPDATIAVRGTKLLINVEE
ncbi:FecR family protein [Leeia oryzae]|uniref:FecR family protein n=1 Tax=Leeia oryzae TaxID=356662 RepID=UPI00039DA3B2|nr:FecR domain-containing protein [Leeia oryzae]